MRPHASMRTARTNSERGKEEREKKPEQYIHHNEKGEHLAY